MGVLWLGACLVGTPLSAAEPPRAVSSLDQIRQGVAESRSRLRSFLAEYVLTGSNPATGQADPVSSCHLVAARGVQRYADNSHFTATFPRELDRNHHQVSFTGKSLDVFYPQFRYYETSQKNARLSYSWKVRGEFFLECAGWWPPDDDTKPSQGGRAFFLHEALVQPGYRVNPCQEQVDETWCHVVELPGVDKLWFDATCGWALRRREWYDPQSHALAARYELSHYREASPGIWIPWKLHRLVYAIRRARAGEPTPIELDLLATVVRAEANQVSEDLFRFTPPQAHWFKTVTPAR